MNPRVSERTGLLASAGVGLSALLWGCWWIPLRALSERGLPTDWTSLVVYGIAALVLLPMALRRFARLRRASALLLAVGLFTGGMLATWNHALITGNVVRVTLLFYLAPIWGTALAIVALDERFTILRLLAIVAGLVGAAVVLGFEGGVPVPSGEGEWMGLASGILFALGATCARKLTGAGEFEKTFLTFVAATILSGVLIVAMPGSSPPPAAVAPTALPLAVGVTVLLLIPITWLLLWGAGHLDPGRVSILLLLEVVAASVSATALTDEPFGWREFAGAVLILSAGTIEGVDQLRDSRRRERIRSGSEAA